MCCCGWNKWQVFDNCGMRDRRLVVVGLRVVLCLGVGSPAPANSLDIWFRIPQVQLAVQCRANIQIFEYSKMMKVQKRNLMKFQLECAVSFAWVNKVKCERERERERARGRMQLLSQANPKTTMLLMFCCDAISAEDGRILFGFPNFPLVPRLCVFPPAPLTHQSQVSKTSELFLLLFFARAKAAKIINHSLTHTRSYFGCANFSTTYRRGAHTRMCGRVFAYMYVLGSAAPGFFSPTFFRTTKHESAKSDDSVYFATRLSFSCFPFVSTPFLASFLFSPFKISHKTSACGCWHVSQRYYHLCWMGIRTPGRCAAFYKRKRWNFVILFLIEGKLGQQWYRAGTKIDVSPILSDRAGPQIDATSILSLRTANWPPPKN